MTQRSGWRGRLPAVLIFAGVLAAAVVVVRLTNRGAEPPRRAGTITRRRRRRGQRDAGPAFGGAGPTDRGDLRTGADGAAGPGGRTVAVVSYDETRLKSVTARVDGWIERLYLDFTGEAVRVGDPLFTLYSPMLVSAQQELLLAKRLRESVAGGSPDAVRGADELLESARRRLLYWEVPAADVAQIESSGEIRKAIIFRSPVRGVVIEKSVLGGQRIMAGETVPGRRPEHRVAGRRGLRAGSVFGRDWDSGGGGVCRPARYGP